MAKYNVTYSCGHSGVVDIIGKHKDREWKLRFEEEKLCPKCYKVHLEAERIRQNEEAARANQEAGLPALEGSEKQVAWAETIRVGLLNEVEKISQRADRLTAQEGYYERIGFSRESLAEATEAIKQRTSASWWIDNRFAGTRELHNLLQAELEQIQKERTAPPAQIVAAAKIEATVRPEEAVTETVAEISISDCAVKIHFPERRDSFRETVKGLKFSWSDGRWERKIRSKNGTPEDRAAEVGNYLLSQGFVVRIFDEAVRQKAISGEYEKECTRWVMARTSGKYEGWFAIVWDRTDDFYRAARRLPGSRYDSPNVVVPPEQYMVVLDFANRYSFRLSRAAQAVAETARAAKEVALVAKVTAPKKGRGMTASTKPGILDVPEEVKIDETLRDED